MHYGCSTGVTVHYGCITGVLRVLRVYYGCIADALRVVTCLLCAIRDLLLILLLGDSGPREQLRHAGLPRIGLPARPGCRQHGLDRGGEEGHGGGELAGGHRGEDGFWRLDLKAGLLRGLLRVIRGVVMLGVPTCKKEASEAWSEGAREPPLT